MPLIIEDGTGVTNANSYASIAYAQSFAESLGLILSDDDDVLSQNLLAAMAYIESRDYKGRPADATQARMWPRTGVYVNGAAYPAGTIPEGVKRAQVAAASLIAAGVDLMPTVSGQVVVEETVGAISTKYSDNVFSTWNGRVEFTAIDAYLNTFLNNEGGYRLSRNFGF